MIGAGLGLRLGLGLSRKAATPATPAPSGTTGQPIGLLLILTKSA